MGINWRVDDPVLLVPGVWQWRLLLDGRVAHTGAAPTRTAARARALALLAEIARTSGKEQK